jgi:potassium efflux system protein
MSSHRHRAAAIAAIVLIGVSAGCVASGGATPPPAVPAAAASAAPAAHSAAAAEPATALDVSEVPRAATVAEIRIRTLRSLAGRTRETDEIRASSASVLASVDALNDWMRSREPQQQTSRALRSLAQEWHLNQEMLGGWTEAISRRLDALSAAQIELRRTETTWAATETSLSETGAAPEILSRVHAIIESIHDLEPQVRAEIESAAVLQSRISSAGLDAEEALDTIAAALREERKTYFKIESPPIWKAFGARSGKPPLSEQLVSSFNENVRALRQYAERAGARLNAQLALFAVLAIVFYRLRRTSQEWPRDQKTVLACARLVERPLFGAALVALLAGAAIHPRAPVAFYELSSILLVVPVIALMHRVVEPRVRVPLFALAAVFIVERLWESTPAGTPLERSMLLGLSGLTAVALWWGVLPPAEIPAIVAGRWWRAVTMAARLGLTGLAVAFAANVVGDVNLARLLTATVVRMTYWAVVLYAAALLLRGTITLLLRSAAARAFHVLERHADSIVRRAGLVIDTACVLFFGFITLITTGQWLTVQQEIGSIVERRWGIGAFQFSFATVIVFLLSAYASIVVSRIITAVLEEDVYTRVTLPRGVPNTLTMLLRYCVISVGFLFAAAIAGIPLDRLAFVLGAFSVGIGFGLQTVVNNFVSGLILMFERPIQIGDTVEIGGLVGRVRSIGVRASQLETADGAAVIVPNGTLISGQLTNWTLSNQNRRVEIPVSVVKGASPERVLTVLRDAVAGQPGVLADPGPSAVLRGFSAGALDFSVHFWTDDFDRWGRIRSDMAVRVSQALREAGFEIP